MTTRMDVTLNGKFDRSENLDGNELLWKEDCILLAIGLCSVQYDNISKFQIENCVRLIEWLGTQIQKREADENELQLFDDQLNFDLNDTEIVFEHTFCHVTWSRHLVDN